MYTNTVLGYLEDMTEIVTESHDNNLRSLKLDIKQPTNLTIHEMINFHNTVLKEYFKVFSKHKMDIGVY